MKFIRKLLPHLLVCIAAIQVSWCQPKLKVHEEDYNKWHTLSAVNISADGLWASYKLLYEQRIDTIVIQQINSGKKLVFPQATELAYSPDSKFALINYPDNSLAIQNLSNLSATKIDSVAKYTFVKNGKCLAVLKNNTIKKQLCIYSAKGKLLTTINDCSDFESSNTGHIALIESSGITIYDANQNFKKSPVLLDSTSSFKNLVWSKSGKMLSFLCEAKDANSADGRFKIFAYDVTLQKRHELNNTMLNGNQISDYIQTPITLSADGGQLFFYYQSKPSKGVNDDRVEIWDSASKLVYPAQKVYGDPALKPKIAVWNIADGSVKLLATDEFPNSFLTWDYKNVLTYSFLTYEPQYEMIAPVDVYITNIQTQTRKLLLKKHQASKFTMGCSPSGQFLHYFKDKNWWSYDVKTGKYTNLTSNLEASFTDVNYDFPGESGGFMSPGWTTDSKFVMLYDQYDIWLVSPDLKTQRRITRGAEQKIRFRICEQMYRSSEKIGAADFLPTSYDLTNGLVLSATGYNKATGYFRWNANGKIEEIAYGEFRVSEICKSTTGDKVLFVKENFETAPALYFSSKTEPAPKKVFQSNAHAAKYQWGTSKIITYKNDRGQELQGALFYPAGFEQGKRYPMVVYIYSNVSQLVHDYISPTMHNPIGFTPSNYTTDGYLVLYPDIKYTVGDPGKSILDCVTSAVNAVIKMGVADEKRVGLLGHSYGGYETCFLLTQTPMFAAAVAGASVTDIISSYLSVNTITSVKMDWRYESQQYRMASTPFNNLKGYLENSPVINAANITTPLLSWAGKNDMQCDWRQSVELHLALRRLSKQNIFLAYQNEGHILDDPAAQKDLTIRIKNWFNYYLKEIPFPNNETFHN